jgi:PKD repeat protein
MLTPSDATASAPSASTALGGAIASLASGAGPADGTPVVCSAATSTEASCGAAGRAGPSPSTAGAGNGSWIELPQGRAFGGLAYDPIVGRVVLFGGENGSGALGDTWTYRVGNWTQVLSSPSPPARELAAMAYDPRDGYVLLFGGYNGTAYLNDTWSYQSGSWTHLSTPVAPSGRAGAGITYDAQLGEIILFGGFNGASYLNDTWKFAAGAWTLLSTTGAIPGRAEAAVTYDPEAHAVLLFGGINSGGYLADTWTLSVHAWTLAAPSTHPSARDGAAMAYDSATQSIILFGGDGSGGYVGDTWTFTGGNWVLVPGTGPSARAGAMIAYDAVGADRYLLLVSGVGAGPPFRHDTWTFTGSWNLLLTGASPRPRSGASLVWDPRDDVAVLFGGYSGSAYLNETWEYIGGWWTELATTAAPSPRAGAAMVFLGTNATASTGYVLLFGGVGAAGYLNDTWKFVAGVWTPIATSGAPSPRAGAAVTFNALTNSTVLFGGIGPTGFLADTFWFNGPDRQWTQSALSPSPSARAYAAATFDPLNDTLLMFGGVGAGGLLNDTWELHGGNSTIHLAWTQDVRAVAPPAVSNATFAWDTVTRYAILEGGSTGGPNPSNAMWLFTHGNWTQVVTAPSPPARFGAASVFDPADYTWILFGGANAAGRLNDTWEWVVFIVRSFASLTTIDATASDQFYPTVFGGVAPYTYFWSFGNGSTSHVRDPAYAFPVAAQYSVSLTVNDSSTNTSTVLLSVTVVPALEVQANATPTAVDAGISVSFNGTHSHGIGPYTVAWTFGDGASSTVSNPSHAYASSGTYDAIYWVNDSGGLSLNRTVTITVGATPVSEPLADPAVTDLGTPIAFSAEVTGGTGPYSYAWLLGDGTHAATQYLNHTYAATGTYDVALWVNDTYGLSAFSSRTVTVNPALGGTVAASPTNVETGRAVIFWGNQTGGTPAYTISWNFGDGTRGTGAETSHAYSTAGIYLVNGWLNDSVGQSVHRTVTVTVSAGPAVRTTSAPTATDVGFAAVFVANVTGGVGPYTLAWLFGDGSSATGTSVTHTYLTPGSRTVTVWGNDSAGGVSNQSFSIQVNPVVAISEFSVPSGTVTVGNSLGLVVTVSGGTAPFSYSYAGLPGGCSSENVSTLTCTPNATGVFNVTVTVKDAVGSTAAESAPLTVGSASPSSSPGFLGLSGDWGYYLLLGIILAIVIVLLAVVLTRRSRPPGTTEPPTETETVTTTTTETTQGETTTR